MNPQACHPRGLHPGHRLTTALGALTCLGAGSLAGSAATGPETAGAGPAPEPPSLQAPAVVRIGIAPGTWAGVNRQDAAAAVAAWAKIIMQQRGTKLEVETKLFETDQEMGRTLKSGAVDAVSMLAPQFLALDPELQPETVFVSAKNQSVAEQYVLLVRQSSGIEKVAGLAGRTLVWHRHASTSLAPLWLDTLLARQSLGPATNLLKTLSHLDNPSKAVLQVYFRQVDACVVTSNLFAVASELNPQLRKDLRVLAASPELVPALFYFRPGHASKARDELEPAIVALHQTPAGRQVLTVFQCERMVKCPLSVFEGTRALLAEHHRLALRFRQERLQQEAKVGTGPERRAAQLAEEER